MPDRIFEVNLHFLVVDNRRNRENSTCFAVIVLRKQLILKWPFFAKNWNRRDQSLAPIRTLNQQAIFFGNRNQTVFKFLDFLRSTLRGGAFISFPHLFDVAIML